ncbi:hypothetical protein ILUMI_11385 [Ignelater luminosus]|uniref:Uncharacterized protein n=1 Tax=Ignelater luminosus TaxID=2038154 RepID=A0A8K0D0C9_IGNLU|nr:hypothetical protein ILUMI_11385 [Ignelater luminosus]
MKFAVRSTTQITIFQIADKNCRYGFTVSPSPSLPVQNLPASSTPESNNPINVESKHQERYAAALNTSAAVTPMSTHPEIQTDNPVLLFQLLGNAAYIQAWIICYVNGTKEVLNDVFSKKCPYQLEHML